jgi:hypothetical protein
LSVPLVTILNPSIFKTSHNIFAFLITCFW